MSPYDAVDEDWVEDDHMRCGGGCPPDCPDCPRCDCCNCQADHTEDDEEWT